ncbi:glycoside hydrolase family 15 protein [Halobacterium zhouii]|uniref:glycoside hydrolase family 15 protein n=1 Tax=Halobacterium zhouii TaxID=2902624 RepID=UPI001E468DB8|nr:glycoside hydrolase family 15 protein [Halobacterium zhouii]
MGYSPIENYGVIGNLETCALVGANGSIDWFCLPHLESTSVFAAILDDTDGGHFSIQPRDSFESEQQYVDQTNVLETRFSTADGEAVLTDFMPVARAQSTTSLISPSLVRRVTCTSGSVKLDVEFRPRFDYARANTVLEPTEYGVVARGNAEQLNLHGSLSVDTDSDSAHTTDSLEAGESAWYLLQYGQPELDLPAYEELFEDTVGYWQSWVRRCKWETEQAGEWSGEAVRSLLLLKLLIHQPTGAIAAAPTTSLPEVIGGVRNWDYRFSWIRDSALTIRSLARMGCREEARGFVEWCRNIMYKGDPKGDTDPFYQPLYGLHGDMDTEEQTLFHLEGYRQSAPVRIGNAASKQRQTDVYGELVLAIYEMLRYQETITERLWQTVWDIVEFVCEIWREPDKGIWEVRSGSRHFVHSKVMCWVAIDRGIRMATTGGFDAPLDHWRQVREEIKQTILDRGYDEELGAFVRAFDSTELDASALRMSILEFLPPDDPRILSTIDVIQDRLATDEGLVYRYFGDDGVPGHENPFVLCSFWLVQSLLLAERHEEAHEIYENVLEYVSPVGLFAEELDPETGEHRGNFPQAFSHIGLIQCALYLHTSEPNSPSPDANPTW